MADPLKYFRVEAREIVEQLERALLELERGQTPAENVAHLLRLAHTLKGAARVVKQLDIASLAHRLEDLLQPFRETPRTPSPPEQEALLGAVDAIRRLVSELQLPARAAPGVPATTSTATAAPVEARPGPGVADELRVSAAPLEHVESLMDGVAELGFQLGSARHALPRLSQSRGLAEQLAERLDPRRNALGSPTALVALRALAAELETKLSKVERELSTSIERAARELGQVRDRVDQLRLVAASSMFGTLERATRDVAVSLGKQALFEAQGGDVRLDADVLGAVQRALLQAVRNAVAHGIEPSQERQAGGKPAAGRVTVQVQRHGKHVSFVCRDDGRGVDLQGVEREAQRLGKLTPSGSADARALLGLLLEGGISTSRGVSHHAGRGVGLDLIREALNSVGGSVQLRSEPGRGTSLELSVPATLSALDALIVETGERACAIPLSAVVQALRFELPALSRSAEGDTLTFEGQVVPFVPLGSLLRGSAAHDEKRRAWSAVIVRGKRGLLALGVDTLLGNEGLVARALPDSVEVDATVAGVTLDQDGNPRLLLDPDGLLEAAARVPHQPSAPAAERRTVLVVDDSLTTRMLEQSILESAGYEVKLATSGEQGLALARAERPDLMLVDVEMPGIDGFEVIRRLRAEPLLATTPAILVTSRASTADVARGREVGASGHIDKGEFDQLAFLEQIGRLIR